MFCHIFVSLRIQFKCEKMQTRKTPKTGTFYALSYPEQKKQEKLLTLQINS